MRSQLIPRGARHRFGFPFRHRLVAGMANLDNPREELKKKGETYAGYIVHGVPRARCRPFEEPEGGYEAPALARQITARNIEAE